MPSVISPAEAAWRLGVSLDYIYKLLWARTLKGQKVNGRWKISEASVEARAKRAAAFVKLREQEQ